MFRISFGFSPRTRMIYFGALILLRRVFGFVLSARKMAKSMRTFGCREQIDYVSMVWLVEVLVDSILVEESLCITMYSNLLGKACRRKAP